MGLSHPVQKQGKSRLQQPRGSISPRFASANISFASLKLTLMLPTSSYQVVGFGTRAEECIEINAYYRSLVGSQLPEILDRFNYMTMEPVAWNSERLY